MMRKIHVAVCMLGLGSSCAKAGHTVELRFDINDNTNRPLTVKLKKVGVNKEKITEITYKEGARILRSQPLVIKIDDHTNENYISRNTLSDFSNGELSQEEYNKFFQHIDFEVDGKALTFEWTQQSPSCLWWRNVYDDFSWDVVETSSSFVDRKTGFHHTLLKIGLRKIGDSIQK